MGARSLTETAWNDFQHQECFNRHEDAHDVIQKLADSFAQLNIATDFLLMKTDAEAGSTDLQLACLIKEGIAIVQEQVTELYQAMNQEDSSPSILKQ